MTTEAIRCYDQSRQEHARRQKVIAGGVNSNVRLHGAPVPLTMVRGDGALLWDVDDNVYIDYAAGMGPMVLGHNHPAVTAAVQQSALRRASSLQGNTRSKPNSARPSSACCLGSRASGWA